MIALEDIRFEPETVTIPANTPVTVTLTNSGGAPHNFSMTSSTLTKMCSRERRRRSPSLLRRAPTSSIATCPVTRKPAWSAPSRSLPQVLRPRVEILPTAESGQNQTAPTELTLKLEDIAFDPKDFTIAANTDVVIHLENTGATLHNFSVDSLGISQDVNPGETKDVTINAPAGTLDYYCAVPGHKEAGMEGTITVGESGAAGQSPPAGDATAPAASGQIAIDLQDIKFVPDTFTVPANTPTTVTLKNIGVTAHNFSIDQLHIDEDVAPGETKTITVTAPVGTYQYYCNVPGHKEAGMLGTLIVQ